MSIKRVNVSVADSKVTAKKSMPEILVEGFQLDHFVTCLAAAETANTALEAAKTAVKELALLPFFNECADKNAPISSIILHDSEGTRVRMTVQNKYPSLDATQGSALFEGMNKDPGDYLAETVKVSFDSKVLVDAVTGEFNNNLYLAMANAMAKVAKDYGVENPLSSATQIVAKPAFHAQRFVAFTPKQNVQIQRTFPATITLTKC